MNSVNGQQFYPNKRDSLKGIKVMRVVTTEFNGKGLFKGQLQTDVELQLRKAGIKVLSADEKPKIDSPAILAVTYDTYEVGEEIKVAIVTVKLTQLVLLERDKSITVVGVTWDKNQ